MSDNTLIPAPADDGTDHGKLPFDPKKHGGSEFTAKVAAIFADIDTLDPVNFVRNLTEDVVFQFGNNDPAVGRAAVEDSVRAFFATIAGMRHEIRHIFVDGDVAIAQIDVVYTRLDGKSVTVPNADILTFEGDKVKDWRIFIDLTPLFA